MRINESDGASRAERDQSAAPLRDASGNSDASRTFRFLSTAVAVRTADAGALTWLEEFLSPPFTVGGDADAMVHLTVDHARYDALRAARERAPVTGDVPFFRMDQEIVSLPGFRAGERMIAHDAKYECFYDVSPTRIEVTARPGATVHRAGVMRVVREIVSVAAVARGGRFLHAGALAFGDAGVIVAGAKRAGKSTLLCYLAGAARARVLANDRVLVQATPDGLGVIGMPTVVGLRPGTLAAFPELARGLPRVARPSALTSAELDAAPSPAVDPRLRLRLSPAEFARRLGVPRGSGASMRAIVFPEPSEDRRETIVERLETGAALACLEGARFSAHTTPRATVFDRMAAPEHGTMADAGASAASLATIAATTPCFRFRASLDAYALPDARIRLLDAVLDERS